MRYAAEHATDEQIDLLAMKNNIQRITEMVQTPSERFDYMERTYSFTGQMTFNDLSLWDFGAYSERQSRSKWLMPLPENARILIGDFPIEDAEMHMIDSSGDVYRYIPEIDGAVFTENAEVLLDAGETPVFDRRKAKHLRVYPLETVLALLE